MTEWSRTHFYICRKGGKTNIFHAKQYALLTFGHQNLFMKPIFWAILTMFSFCTQAQVIISEYSASNLRDFEDDFGGHEDWIELYNSGNTAVNLGGWYLSDKENKPKKWQIPQGWSIEAGGYLLIWASGRDVATESYLHTNFKFTQTNGDEFVVLSNANGTIVDKTAVEVTALAHSRGRRLGQGPTWYIFTQPTPAFENEGPWYKAYAPRPKIQTKAGFYDGAVETEVTATAGFQLRYTLDGRNVSQEDALYTGSLTIDNTSVLKVRHFSDDTLVLPGLMDFATYFINEPETDLPVVSVASDDAVTLAEGDRDLNPISSFEYFNGDGNKKATSFGELDSHGQDSWINPQRSLDWISRDEMGYNSGIKEKIFKYSERDEYQRIILRASGDDNYPSVGDQDHEGSTHIRDEYVHTLVQNSDMHLDVRAVERCLVYLNGQFWGVYTLREKPDDHDYIEYTYKQDKYDIQFLKTWGESWAEYGEETAIRDWETLRDYILQNDMSDPQNFKTVEEQLDLTSLMDYMIANLSVVSSDWMNYNTGWWRGLNPEGGHQKWAYIMWDNDATFDYYINYSGVPNTNPDAQACDLEDIASYMDFFFPADTTWVVTEADSFFIDGQWYYFPADSFYVYPDLGKHEKIFLKLMDENIDFRNRYFARYADMNSTIFRCDVMLSTLDSLLNIVTPEMPRQVERWGGSMQEWQQNIETLKDFISRRCTLINDGIANCYNLSGPYQVVLQTDPPQSGSIRFNTLTHTTLPWTGVYFGNMNQSLVATAKAGYTFEGWQTVKGTTSFESQNSTTTSATITAPDTLVAVFRNITATHEQNINTLTFYPNPTSGLVSITNQDYADGSAYEIINADGKKVANGQITHQQINLEGLVPGIYAISVRKGDLVAMGKVVLMR
jgi:hypothetical protein